jgi:hypothetical protein
MTTSSNKDKGVKKPTIIGIKQLKIKPLIDLPTVNKIDNFDDLFFQVNQFGEIIIDYKNVHYNIRKL